MITREQMLADFARFRDDRREMVRIELRRARAQQIRGWLAGRNAVNSREWDMEIAQFECNTKLYSESRLSEIFNDNKFTQLLAYRLREALSESRVSRNSNVLMLQGNYIHGAGRKRSIDSRTIRKIVESLQNDRLKPIDKYHILCEEGQPDGFSAAMVMIYHPREFILYCPQTHVGHVDSKVVMQELASTDRGVDAFQAMANEVSEWLGADDFIELDRFFYWRFDQRSAYHAVPPNSSD